MPQSKTWPNQALVGYVEAYGSTNPPNVTYTMITEAITNGYRIFVYAFGSINSDNQVSLPSGINPQDLSKQIEYIHENNGLALLSFGGANNTFLPGSGANVAASNTVDICTKYKFDGVDLDLEHIDVDIDYLESYIKQLKSNNDLFLTAAPQIGGGYNGGPATLAPIDIFTTSFLEAVRFDALFIQEYNQYGGAVFNGLKDTDVGFVCASFDPLTKIIPPNTKIIVGEPANRDAASGLKARCLVEDIKSCSIRTNSQYGGIMVWAINYDFIQNWSFAKTVYPSLINTN